MAMVRLTAHRRNTIPQYHTRRRGTEKRDGILLLGRDGQVIARLPDREALLAARYSSSAEQPQTTLAEMRERVQDDRAEQRAWIGRCLFSWAT